MSSQRRIQASRANGARSRGPVTEEGKQRSALNALRHGLLSKTVVLGDEDPEAFRVLVQAFVDRVQPADDIELGLVEQMASAWWRQSRSWAVENRIIDNAASASPNPSPVDRITHAFTTLAPGPELALMHRYETRQSRMFQRALRNLALLRKQNLPNEPSPISEHLAEPAPEPLPEPVAVPALHPEPVPEAPPAAAPPRKPILLAPADFPDVLDEAI